MISRVHLRIALLVLLGSPVVNGQQTLHLIYTANAFTHDSIYAGCQVDERNATDLFTEVGLLATENGQPLRVAHHRPRYDKTALVRFLEELDPDPEDAVVFMFSGHGLEDPQRGHWPVLYYCDEPEEGFDFPNCGLSLERIHRMLRETGVRMSLTIASSCNHDPLVEENERTVRSLSPDERLERSGTNYDFGLFTNFRGHILASASKAGQPAYLTDAEGSYYVRALLQSIIDGLVADNSSWARILHRTDLQVREGFQKKQHAQFRIYAPDSATPATPPAGDLPQLAYLLLEEGLIGQEEWTEAELNDQLYRLYAFYDGFLARHQPAYSEEIAYDDFVTALDEYGSPEFDVAYENALTQFAYLPEAQLDEIDDFLYPADG